MADTTVFRHVLDGFRADIARRTELIAAHRSAMADLEAANAADARSAAAAEALALAVAADMVALWRPVGDMEAAALVADMVLTGGMPGQGKAAAARRLVLAALCDATADIAATDGDEAAGLVHDHDARAGDCPACCLLSGGGDASARRVTGFGISDVKAVA